jgi:hypothetical protein|tara:strand:+ start:110 stop:352 length:243 start_codon:yes stop_codon:yes gene_type:complete
MTGSRKGCRWDTNKWTSDKNKNQITNALYEDDPRAEDWDKYGRVYNQYGTLPVRDRCWSDEEALLARKRPAGHLFKKKYQ